MIKNKNLEKDYEFEFLVLVLFEHNHNKKTAHWKPLYSLEKAKGLNRVKRIKTILIKQRGKVQLLKYS